MSKLCPIISCILLSSSSLTIRPPASSENQPRDAWKIDGPISRHLCRKKQDLCLPRSDPTSPRPKVCLDPLSSGLKPVAEPFFQVVINALGDGFTAIAQSRLARNVLQEN
jgi:hypothetical protein